MFLLDTNICIYIINNSSSRAVHKIKTFQLFEIKLSAISFAELEYGAAKSKLYARNRLSLIHFASAFDIIPFDEKDAEVYGMVRAKLERQGKIIGPYDLQIAAQALARKLTLVTNNTAEFKRIKELRLENWV